MAYTVKEDDMTYKEKQARANERRGNTMKEIILLARDMAYCSGCGLKHRLDDVEIGKRGVRDHVITCSGCGRTTAIHITDTDK